ncbi:DUF3098 domain-containing protein [Parapedobacter sp. ISTM3]|uniref:DUF3098 domain-containing protein n=1 Tax=Parapedobacter luteus TaxID=623280 RepID=A0A1T5E4H8_9SPHI|nr:MULTISPECIES: DUF3098 domain-containing protein [Parapedobacter]MBK1441069.1 DUF3098 domain-containing protein [Parapedobacter sp. ISTM3]SKB78764.1 Protein of unknown function [Parapedobacter luteus]
MSYKKSQQPQKASFVFGKRNYQFFLLSIAVVILGFILMMGTSDIYSFTKITLAPLIVVIGFALGVVAILIKPKNTGNSQ